MIRFMKKHICPWWIGYLLLNPLRRIWQNPARILRHYLKEGMTVLEPGCGMGYFTLALARLVGPQGRVVVVEVQEKMLNELGRRAHQAGLDGQIEKRRTAGDSLGVEDLSGKVDFVLAFAMVHELPDAGRFFREAHAALKPGGRLLFSEPSGHVNEAAFSRSLSMAESAGFTVASRPAISLSKSAVLVKCVEAAVPGNPKCLLGTGD